MQTGSTPNPQVRYVLDVPDTIWVIKSLRGALSLYASEDVWEQSASGISSDDAKELFSEIYESLRPDMRAGIIFAHALRTLPDDALRCDGSVYSRVDYPELYDALDVNMILTADLFKVPDLRSRTIVGSGTGPFGMSTRNITDAGGDEQIYLSETQMPSHTHFYNTTIPGVLTVGLEPPVPAALPGGLVATSGAGLGAAHGNMQPFYVVHYAIWAK